jgi:hypothetical protein
MSYFVMLSMGFNSAVHRVKGDFPLPLVDLEGEIILFDTEEDAKKAAQQHIMGEIFGFQIYEW